MSPILFSRPTTKQDRHADGEREGEPTKIGNGNPPWAVVFTAIVFVTAELYIDGLASLQDGEGLKQAQQSENHIHNHCDPDDYSERDKYLFLCLPSHSILCQYHALLKIAKTQGE